MLPQVLPVALVIRHLQDGGTHEPMAKGALSTPDISVRKIEHFLSQKGHNGIDRTRKGDAQTAPPHGFGERDASNEIRQHLLEQSLAGKTGFFFDDAKIGSAGRFFDLNRIERHPLAFGKSFGSLCRLAVGVKSHLPGRSDHFRRTGFLLPRQIRDHQHQAPRSPRSKRRTPTNPVFIKIAPHLHRHGFEGRRDISRWNFFATNFEIKCFSHGFLHRVFIRNADQIS